MKVVGHPDNRWLDPLARACAALVTMFDSDPTARVRVTPAGDDLVVQITLDDGRSTSRRIRVPEALLPTLEALLTLPTVLRAIAPRSTVPIDPQDPPDRPQPDEPGFGVEIGGGMGVRAAGPGTYLMAAPSAFAQVRGGAWLFGMGLRWEVLERFTGSSPIGFEAEAIALALTLARRMTTPFGHLDLGVSPRLISQTQTYLPDAGELSGTNSDIRPALFVRAGFGHSAVRFLIEGDVEVSPTHLRRDIRIDPTLPRLPWWSAGLSVGAIWGAP